MQNYIHVDEACEYVKLAVENYQKVQGKILLVVSKKEYSNNDLAQIVAQETQAEIIYSNIDNSKSLRYNNDITRKLLGFTSQISFEYQIQEYIKWKKEQS
jgi:nucleoside-diphosphate-sugar epimerase